MDMCTHVLYLKWVTNKDLLYSIQNSVQSYVAAWMGGGLGRTDTYICTAESPHCSPEATTTLLDNQLCACACAKLIQSCPTL